ncbi:universal stress protein [Salidesulfovibrio brasiliensis]
MYEKIILAATSRGETDHAAQTAFELCRRHGAKLVIFHACRLPREGWGTVERLISKDELVEATRKDILDNYSGRLEGIDYSTHVVCGDPAEELASTATHVAADLIVMGPHCRDGECSGDRMWGLVDSTVQRVTSRVVAPVMVVTRPNTLLEHDPEHILVCTDMAIPSENAVCHAASLARRSGAKVTVFSVLDVGLSYPNPKFYQRDMEDFIQDTLIRMERKYTRELEGVEHTFEAWEGVPYTEILKAARWKNADMMIMARHSSVKDSHRVIIGSTVGQVALSPSCPTVVINYRAKACR